MPADEIALEELLAEPTPALIDAMARLAGDIMVLGAAGKMGPSLCRMALRASRLAGSARRVIAVARFTDPAVRQALEDGGVRTVVTDLIDPAALAALPDAPNIIYMAGRKFGTADDNAATWATNVYLPGLVAERFAKARIVAFSTGNVYPLTPLRDGGSRETDAVGPVGTYAQSALAREAVLEFQSRRHGTPMVIVRLNYAIEPRYGVLRDIADKVWRGERVDLGMGYVNVIWQRDANAVALRAFDRCTSPPTVLNLTGRPAIAVRELARRFGVRFKRDVHLHGLESPTTLLSDPARCELLFGPPPVSVDEMIELVAGWVEQGGRSLERPTHFQQRDGRF